MEEGRGRGKTRGPKGRGDGRDQMESQAVGRGRGKKFKKLLTADSESSEGSRPGSSQSSGRGAPQQQAQSTPPQSPWGSSQQQAQSTPPQSAWGSSQQQVRGVPPQSAWGSSQQQVRGVPPQSAWGSSQQQAQSTPPQSARGAPQQQIRGVPPQSARGAPQQQVRGVPPQSARGAPQQQVRGVPPQSAWGAPQQQAQSTPTQSAWGTPQQQAQSTSTQSAWGAPQQQVRGVPPQSASDKSRKEDKNKKTAPSEPTASTSKPTEVRKVSSSMSEMSLAGTGGEKEIAVPSRQEKQGQKFGKSIRLETNHLPIVMKNANMNAYQYDVSIEPDKPKYMQRMVWNEFVRRNFPKRNPSYDGKKIAVSAGPLADGIVEDAFQVMNPENEKMKEFKVTLKLAAVVDMSKLKVFLQTKDKYLEPPTAQLAVLDIVLRNYASNRLVRAGRNFFSVQVSRPMPLGDGMDCYTGYYQSASLGWKLYLNFDVAHKGFPFTDILRAVKELCLTRGNNSEDITPQTQLRGYQIESLEKHLKGLKVEYMLPNEIGSKRVFKINGVRDKPASREVFEITNEKTKKTEKTDVVRYFRTHKNYSVRYPNLPCLWVGSVNNHIYVPIELCKILPGQVRNGKLTEIQTRRMIQHAAAPPPERKRITMEQFHLANFSNEFTNEFGISVSGKMEEVKARILPAPQLNAEREIKKGQWEIMTFQETRPLQRWCVVCMDEGAQRHVKNFKTQMMHHAERMGLRMSSPLCPDYGFACDPSREQKVLNMFQTLDKQNVQLAFVFIPDRGNYYQMVKRVSEIDVGVLTQCVRSSTLQKSLGGPRGPNSSLFSNILLKVNAKLNGTNHTLDPHFVPRCLKEGFTMVIGADVTHQPPDAPVVPSVAAVTGSFDENGMRYHSIRMLQPSNVEIIQDFESITRDLICYFFRQRRTLPRKIVVFRDGVSEGQVSQVLHYELLAMRKACVSLRENYRPPITYLIVQKRHHTRFYPVQSGSDNVPPGTCVDTEIVHPRDLDFYLVSHFSRLGTARPTKYKLIYDDSDMTEHELEILSYYLCHLIVRCTKSISYPAPTYYAHLAALRGRVHLCDKNVDFEKPKSVINKDITVKEKLNDNPMFFV